MRGAAVVLAAAGGVAVAARPAHMEWLGGAGLRGALEGGRWDAMQDAPAAPAAPADLRVSKALGQRGYESVRVSMVGVSAGTGTGRDEVLAGEFDVVETFTERWTHAYDNGAAGVVCKGEEVLSSEAVREEADCLLACNADENCASFSYRRGVCILGSPACEFTQERGSTTYRKLGRNMLYSKLVDLEPGNNKVEINGSIVEIELPKEDSGTSGIVWADPCVSSRWVSCTYDILWDVVGESRDMLNAIGKDPSVHFFQILGDNFYDQDGRLTRSLFDQLDSGIKRKFFMTVPGNHDFWVHGAPSSQTNHDQFGHGFMQYYAQDTLGALDANPGDIFNRSISPDIDPHNSSNADGSDMRNAAENFFWYHKLGNLGFIGYSGAATVNETLEHLQQACAYFETSKPAFVFIATHWNEPGEGAEEGMQAPTIRNAILEMPGCDLGDRIKYLDGHVHCNAIQENGANEAVGFTIGGRGMWDLTCLPVAGFLYIDSSRDDMLRVFHFKEHTLFKNNHPEILACVQQQGIGSCTHLAELWLETPL